MKGQISYSEMKELEADGNFLKSAYKEKALETINGFVGLK